MTWDALLADISALIERGITWDEQHPEENPHDARFFIGLVDGFRIVISSFDIEYQGFPPGSRGHDGMIMGGGSLVRLTREQAKSLCEDAMSALDQSAPQ